jgi:hypothetical protein
MPGLCQVCGKRLGKEDISMAVAAERGGKMVAWLTDSICQDCFTKKDLNEILPHSKASIKAWIERTRSSVFQEV